MFRLLRTLLLLTTGAIAGMAGAAAALRGWLTSRGDATSDDLELVAIFDGIELKNRSTAFRGGRVLAWFGGISLDLSDATLAPDARIDVRSLFGGISVTVPAGCRVESDARAIIGGISASVRDPEDPDAPTLVVRALSVVGGIAIER